MLAVVTYALLVMSLSQQAPASPPQRIGGDVAQASLLVRVNPVYPPLARAARVQDYVMLQGVIGKDGKLADLRILHGHPLLNDSALQAIGQWQYKPQELNGQPIEVVTTITVNFALPPNPNAPTLPVGSAVISGQVRDPGGRSLPGVHVLAVVAGDGTMETKAVSALVQSDSTGAFRIENLPPGAYHVLAATGRITFYPGVTDIKDAVAVTIGSDQTTLVGIDFTLP